MIRAAFSRHPGTKSRSVRLVLRVVVCSGLIVALARPALACPVCFGNSDAPLAVATNTGIIFMLGIVGVMLSAFATFFIYLIRRANRLAAEAAKADAAGLAPSEGTAQC